jgi:hydrogenase nickel incorporation protein HypB
MRIVALNLMSSPGSGKTTLLERTIADTRGRFALSVVQGDQATDNDAARIRNAGARAVQINTGTGCHLDARMVARGLGELAPEPGSVVAIENVGNLVCPALFALGEHVRVAILSVTEGADKPLKYPYLFRGSDVVIFNKADLLPYVDFDLDVARRFVRSVAPDAVTFVVSAKTGEGMSALYDALERRLVRTVTGRMAEACA